MNTKSTIRVIYEWLSEFRPDLNKEQKEQLSDKIYEDIKEEIIDLETYPSILVVREYLRLNYSAVAFEIIQEVMKEAPYQNYNLEQIGDIMREIGKNRIIEKYGFNIEALADNEQLKKEIRKVIHTIIH
ncbi:hypothetical protein [Capnocytophaga canis]|uniref:Uncharacterized protein n=1 Tax=Capnocytophaga canis TaxID=1848903 RepID=A0A0B7IQA5_9FLAO|nr:hypothetical protein [Capnocytophaga canis]CEN52754.1 conserved hypothetical protein [Capnocytophaga canis]